MSLRPKASALAPVGARPGRRSRLDAVLAAGRAHSGAPTGEFYALPYEEARDLLADGVTDPHTLNSLPAGAARDDDDATFRLPLPESAPKNADGSYKYRVYDAASLWEWVRRAGKAIDPMDRTPLLRSDWEALRDRYSSAAANPTPALSVFRRPITNGLWPPGVPYVPPPLTDATIRDAVQAVVQVGGPDYAHPVYGPIAGWDVSAVTDMSNTFHGAAAFNGDLSGWDVGNVKNMFGMFNGARAFNGDLSRWDVRNVTNMAAMFRGAAAFNGDLSGWDVRNVTHMDFVFCDAAVFNGDLSDWDVLFVTDMAYMFARAAAFNGDLSRWDVRSVTTMYHMFEDAAAFNGDLSRWDVRNVTDMTGMFEGAVAYRPAHALGSRPRPPPPPPPLTDATIRGAVGIAVAAGGPDYAHPVYGPIAGWDVSAVTDMAEIFCGWEASDGFDALEADEIIDDFAAFNGDLSGWDVRNVTNMYRMFGGAEAFNGDLSGWDVSAVTEMYRMFEDAAAFNGDLSRWDVSNVTSMTGMFEGAAAFNGDLSRWNVRNVTDMTAMFNGARAFNGDLSRWDVSNVTSMWAMFEGAAAFNGDLSRWDVRNVTDRRSMFEGAVAYRPAHALGSRRP